MRLLSLFINGQDLNLPNAPTTSSFLAGDVFQLVIQLLFIAAIFLSLFFIIYGGFRWITSGGDKQQLDNARKTIIYAVLGLMIALLAFLFLNIATQVLHVPFVTGQKF